MVLSAKPYLRSISLDPKARIDYDAYPFTIPAIRKMRVVAPHRDVTFFVGENGAGKSTLLEALAYEAGLPAHGGGRQMRHREAPSSPLHQYLRLVKSSRLPRAAFFLRAENAFSAIGKIDEANAIAPGSRDSLHARSHGEGFIELLLGLTDGGLYFLDEPEAALSPSRQLAALAVIDRLVRNGCQFIIATHSPILLSYPNAKILSFDEGGIHEIAYEDTEHYAVTRDFLNHYERRLEQLLGEDEP
jgi:predicted ATPase